MTFPDLTELRSSQDQLEYLATASIVVPCIIYTIFLIIIPVSLILLSFAYHRADKKLNPNPPPTEGRAFDARSYPTNFNNIMNALDVNYYKCFIQKICKTKMMSNKSSSIRGWIMRYVVATNWGKWLHLAESLCTDQTKFEPCLENDSSDSLSENSARKTIFNIAPILQWLGLVDGTNSEELSNYVNLFLWPMYSYFVLGLAKPVVLFIFATFLITLTVFPDEGRSLE